MKRRDFLKLSAVGAIALAVPAGVAEALGGPHQATVEASTVAQNFYVGDVITFAGRYATNPVTGKATNSLQRFIVTAIVDDSVIIHPSITSLGRKAKKSEVLTGK